MASPGIDIGLKGGLLTGGLGRPACKGIITMLPFQLGCFLFEPPPPPPPPVPPEDPNKGGGAIPLAPGEIHDFYQPVDGEGLEGTLADPSVYGKRMVRILVTSRFFEGEKEFMISEKRGKYIIKAVNIINNTRNSMRVTAAKIRNVASGATIAVKKFIWRSKP